MTTQQTHGAIIYYPADGGAISRTVTAADVAAIERKLELASANLDEIYQWYRGRVDENHQLRMQNDAFSSAYAVAAAIMRSQPVGIAPRLVQAWQEAQQRVEAVQEAS